MATSPNTDFTSGQILTATQQNNFPRGVMQYVKSTANATVTTTTIDVTAMTVSFTAVANRLYRATFEGFFSVGSPSQNQFFITDGSNNQLDQMYQDTAAGAFAPVCFQYIFTTTAGSKTIKVRATTSAGTMTLYGATADNRSYSFMVEDLGPA
jgi:hypothetical protein